MHWIALSPSHEPEMDAWGWRALQFTPRVARVEEALLLEVSGSERLWGGRGRLLRLLFKDSEPLEAAHWAEEKTSLTALGLLRLKLAGQAMVQELPGGLPLAVLSAASEHVQTLARTGCRTWGQLRCLPRGGVARRFGAALLDALDAAYGEHPESYPWLTLPEVFDQKLELPALATSTPQLMWSAQRLLSLLQVWLLARHRGVLALELEWTLDLKRLNGKLLPPRERLEIRTARPAQDTAHLRRLVGEHLARATLAAPASHLRLRSLETVPWAGASQSLLPEDRVKGERLHELVERLSARLGPHSVVVPRAQADHRPERMQRWTAAKDAAPTTGAAPQWPADDLYPTWLLPCPIPLAVLQDRPQYHGPLRLLTRVQRIEAAWWENQGLALRDYFIARSDEAGLLWIYCERPAALSDAQAAAPARWFLQGLYA